MNRQPGTGWSLLPPLKDKQMKSLIAFAIAVGTTLISSCGQSEQEKYSAELREARAVEAAQAAERKKFHQREGGLNLVIDEKFEEKPAQRDAKKSAAKTTAQGQ